MIDKLPDELEPGSQEAVDRGCTCPVYDNHFGEGVPNQGWWINGNCPIHGLEKS